MSKIDEYKQLWHDECIKEGESLWKECKVDEVIKTAIGLKESSVFVTIPNNKQTVFECYCKNEGLTHEYIGKSHTNDCMSLYSLSGWEGGLL